MAIGERLLLPATSALFIVGAPLYFALDYLALLPPPLRDGPWPFVLVALVGATSAAAAVRWGDEDERTWAKGSAIVCALSAAAIIVMSRLGGLPPSPPALPIGTHVPPVTLFDQRGAPVELASPGGPQLLVVFRGVWCPYCRKELARLAEQVPRFSSTPVRVYGISGDPPEALLRQQRLQELPFTLLSDPEQKVTSLCRNSMHCLLLFDRDGTLRWGGFSESWRSPPRYEDVLQTAYRLD